MIERSMIENIIKIDDQMIYMQMIERQIIYDLQLKDIEMVDY